MHSLLCLKHETADDITVERGRLFKAVNLAVHRIDFGSDLPTV